MLDDGVSRLIGRIYEGVQSAASLEAAADEMLDRLGGAFGLIATADCENAAFKRVHWLNRLGSLRDRIVQEYQGEMQPVDPAFIHVNGWPAARLFDSARDVPRDQHQTHPYMQWMKARFGSTHWMLAYTPPAAALSFGLSVQPRAGGGFDKRQRALFRLLFEHFERALRLAARPPVVHGGAPTFLIDAAGHVLGLNPAAETLLAPGGGLRIDNRVLAPEQRASRPAFVRLVRSALGALRDGSAGGTLVLPRGPGRRALVATADPFPAQAGSLAAFCPGAVIRVVDLEAMTTATLAPELIRAFALTPAEARLAQALLATDGTLREVAARCGIAYGTARAQLASVFEKTGTQSQVSLVRLLIATTR